jgi:hypothetical protein
MKSNVILYTIGTMAVMTALCGFLLLSPIMRELGPDLEPKGQRRQGRA